MIVLDLALMLAGLYLFWCALVFAVGAVVVMSAVLHDWITDQREARRDCRLTQRGVERLAAIGELESIPHPGEWLRWEEIS